MCRLAFQRHTECACYYVPAALTFEVAPLAVKQEDPRRFLHPETIARISRLDLRARKVVEGFISGMHRSPFFGHSVEFVQHRDYTAGDDIRHLDWKVWSKTDHYLHQAVRGRNQPALPSGGRRQPSRCTTAGARSTSTTMPARIAACLAYLLLRQQDAVGLMTFDDDVRQVVPARSQNNAHRRHLSRPWTSASRKTRPTF